VIDYSKILNKTIQDIKPSGIRKFFDIAQEMDDVISLGVGEPDFQTPWSVRQCAIKNIETKRTVYTANAGLEALRRSVSKYILKKTGTEYDPLGEVIITVGGSEAIDISIRSLVEPGDEVLVVEPSFVCYTPIVRMSGGIPVSIETKAENGFKLTKEELIEKITEKTKLLVLSYPNNPTGAVMGQKELEEIAEVVKEKNIMVLSDEIYAELTYVGKHFSIASLPDMKERTIVVNGFSKAFAMTGWRLGFCLANSVLTKQITKVHQYAIMSSPTTSQYAAIEALQNGEESIKSMVAEYNDRRKVIVDGFNKMGFTCFSPDGAFYVFPSIKRTGLSSEEFCMRLLEEEKVALVPGNAFGESGEGFVRASYAYSLEQIRNALERIQRFAEKF